MEKTYIAIDLKSFYASVECFERGLDPLSTNLVVADVSRTDKTICLAVSPSLKAYGIPGRARLFEVRQKLARVNAERAAGEGMRDFEGAASDANEIALHPRYKVDFIAATPQMAKYEEISAKIYSVYLRYIAPEDIHVYSIDEVFMDATAYLNTYKMTGHELAMKMIHEVLKETGITATAGIAPNLYLAKVAMDVVAKHIPADKDGVRIAELNEMSYRKILWNHKPLTDFWRVGPGIAKKLNANGIYTMGDLADIALKDENFLFRLFGVNAEYLIDHAFGREPVGMADIKSYKPKYHSMGEGQVLMGPYPFDQARIIVKEMAENLSYQLLEKGLVTDSLVLNVGYDISCLEDPEVRKKYKGPVGKDWYGRMVPKPSHGTKNLETTTDSAKIMTESAAELFDEIAEPSLFVRRLNVTCGRIYKKGQEPSKMTFQQFDLFTDYESQEKEKQAKKEEMEREEKAQIAMLALKKKFGKNAVVKGRDLQEGATAIQRNGQIGGHKA